MINVHWMSNIQLVGLLFQEKIYAQCIFSDGDHKNGFKLLVTCEDLDFGIKNQNLWVKSIKEIQESKMTPSQTAKQLGCKSLAQVSRETKTPIRTLRDWFTSRPLVFRALCEYTKTRHPSQHFAK